MTITQAYWLGFLTPIVATVVVVALALWIARWMKP